MKKSIILIACIVCISKVFGQIDQYSSHEDSVKYLWQAKTDITAVTKNLLIDFTDTAISPSKNGNTINLKHLWTTSAYTMSYDNIEKALRVDVNIPTGNFNYGNMFGFEFINRINNESKIFNPFTEHDTVNGIVVDMSNSMSKKMTLEYKVQNLDDSAALTMMLMDVNGRISDNTLAMKPVFLENTSYKTITFDWQGKSFNSVWNKSAKDMADVGSMFWWGLNTGRYSNQPIGYLMPESGNLPSIGNPGVQDIYALDETKICGWQMYVDFAEIATKPIDKIFTIFIKNVRIGDIASPEMGYGAIKYDSIPEIALTKDLTETEIALNNYFKYSGATFTVKSSTNSNVKVAIVNNNATISQTNPCNSFDEYVMFYANLGGKSFPLRVHITQESVVAIPFTFNDITEQTSPFQQLDLSSYIDSTSGLQKLTYTLLNNESAMQFNVSATNQLEVSLLNSSWVGANKIKLSATDQCGNKADTNFVFIQNPNPSTVFTSSPKGTFSVSSDFVQPNEELALLTSLTNTNSVNWEITGGTPSTSTQLAPTVTFAKSGTYSITLHAKNSITTGTITKTIKVIGIEKKLTKTCKGKSYTFKANQDMADYLWSDGSVTQSITVSPSAQSVYTVTVTYNNKTFVDSVELKTVQAPYIDSLKIATIDKNSKNVLLAWERTKNNGTLKYNIYREGLTDIYAKIGELPFDSVSVFVDSLADINKRAYKYKITTTDTCGLESSVIKAASQKTIHLQQNVNNNKLLLSWTLYEGSKILGYSLLEGPSFDKMKEIDQFATDQTTYTIENPGNNKYRIVSIFADTITPKTLKSDNGPFSQSLSNMAESELTNESINSLPIYLVTIPNPAHGTFTCMIKNEQKKDLLLQVIDNLGQIVFEKAYCNVSSVEQKISVNPGNYFIKLVTNGFVKIQSVICY